MCWHKCNTQQSDKWEHWGNSTEQSMVLPPPPGNGRGPGDTGMNRAGHLGDSVEHKSEHFGRQCRGAHAWRQCRALVGTGPVNERGPGDFSMNRAGHLEDSVEEHFGRQCRALVEQLWDWPREWERPRGCWHQ